MPSSKIMGYNLDNSVLNEVAQENSVQEINAKVDEAKISANSADSKATQILTKLDEMGSSSGSNSGGVQTFTSNGTFTVPEGVTKIYITAAGGGGGGGGAYYAFSGGGGGGGACIYKKPFVVTPGSQLAITIGSGGSGGTSHRSTPSMVTSGGNGGSTVIGNLITLEGGQGAKSCCTDRVIIGGYGGDAGHGGGGGGAGGRDASSTAPYYTPGGIGYVHGENQKYLLGAISSSSADHAFPGNGGAGQAGGAGGGVVRPSDLSYVLDRGSGVGAGGGGSVGSGGNGGYRYNNTLVTNPTAGVAGGGGGGGCTYGSYVLNGAAGGNGIVIIEW